MQRSLVAFAAAAAALSLAWLLSNTKMAEEKKPKKLKVVDGLRKSWVPVPAESDFPIQNLPWGIFRPSAEKKARPGVAIGDHVLDLSVLHEAGLFSEAKHLDSKAFTQETLNAFMGQDKEAWIEARELITHLLDEDTETLRDNEELKAKALHDRHKVIMELPAKIGDYTDFYSSKNHAYNVGVMFRGPENALQPNWLWLPVGYHGRASSVVLSGVDLHRPRGQLTSDDKSASFDACKLLDFELELAFFVGGKGNKLGHPISMKDAEKNIFGVVLMNDWSARDIQKWEYVPLGPFGAKNFGTSISPWVVSLEALKPFKTESVKQEPAPLAYLKEDEENIVYNINLQVDIKGKDMKEPFTVSRSNAKYLYWSFKQQLVHHTVTGCNMQPGDLLGSGTISGPDAESYGSMLEITWRGSKPVTFPDGSVRKFLADGDEVIMKGHAQGNGYRVGFGECRGKVLPAVALE